MPIKNLYGLSFLSWCWWSKIYSLDIKLLTTYWTVSQKKSQDFFHSLIEIAVIMERCDVVRMLRGLTLLLPLSTSSIWEVVEKHNHCRSNQDTRRRERLDADGGLGLHTHRHTHISLHCNYSLLEFEMQSDWHDYINLFIVFSYIITRGGRDTCWPQKESKPTLRQDLYRHLYRSFFYSFGI